MTRTTLKPAGHRTMAVPRAVGLTKTASLLLTVGLCFSGLGLSDGAQAQQKPVAPCGPKADLSAELANNVAADSRCFEIRMYTVDKSRVGTGDLVGDIDMLHQRFREEEISIFQKHGAEILGVFQSLDNPDTLVWMLAYRDRAHRQEVWAGFAADPAWKALLAKYNVPIKAEVFMLSASDYSPMK